MCRLAAPRGRAVPTPRAPWPALLHPLLRHTVSSQNPQSPQSYPPTNSQLLPRRGPKGAATSQEASPSLPTHTTQRCGKKNLVQSFVFTVIPEFKNPLGSLPEQGDTTTNQPTWPHTLSWGHTLLNLLRFLLSLHFLQDFRSCLEPSQTAFSKTMK